MGLRRTALEKIIEVLDGQLVDVPDGNGKVIRVVDTFFNPEEVPYEDFPKFSCVPSVENIQVGLLGRMMDATYRIALIGYVTPIENESLFGAGEDVIEKIVQTLTSQTNIEKFMDSLFSIVEIGPILAEQFDEVAKVVYVSIQLVVQFVEN